MRTHQGGIDHASIRYSPSILLRLRSNHQDQPQPRSKLALLNPLSTNSGSIETTGTDSCLQENQATCEHPTILQMKDRRLLQGTGSYRQSQTRSKVPAHNTSYIRLF